MRIWMELEYHQMLGYRNMQPIPCLATQRLYPKSPLTQAPHVLPLLRPYHPREKMHPTKWVSHLPNMEPHPPALVNQRLRIAMWETTEAYRLLQEELP